MLMLCMVVWPLLGMLHAGTHAACVINGVDSYAGLLVADDAPVIALHSVSTITM